MLRERFICPGCLLEMPLTRFWMRPHNPMADRFNERIQETISAYEPYSYAVALFRYNAESGYRNICRHLKYGHGIESGRYFSDMLGSYLASSAEFADVDVVIPVPLHWTRRWKRGYNQSQVIAERLAAALGVELETHALVRSRRTRTQTKLSVEKKTANVKGAFRTTSSSHERLASCRHVLLVDDTFTTGATLNACRTGLRAVLPPGTRISVATLAFVSSD